MESGKPQHRAAPRPLSVYLGAAIGMLPPDVTETVRAEHQTRVKNMIRGIKKYQAHAYYRDMTDLKQIWSKGTSTLRFCPAKGEATHSILLIPSMINGSEILDLLPGRSFTRWMAEQGFDVYLFDWGNSVDDDGLQSIDAVIERLAQVGQFVKDRAGKPIDTLGYCMGGTLLLGVAAKHPDIFGKLVLLSAPWDFQAGDPRMQVQVNLGTPLALQLLEAKDLLPVDWIQNVFAHVNPALAISKFSNFLDMADGSTDEKIFIAVEDWLNSGQDIAGGVARTCILDWYGRNTPVCGGWVDLEALERRPVLVVAAEKDILVPPESASAAIRQIAVGTLIKPPCGHISLMAGRNAETMVWVPVRDWLKGLA
jgi:polyhydroxyalkanoate synthase